MLWFTGEHVETTVSSSRIRVAETRILLDENKTSRMNQCKKHVETNMNIHFGRFLLDVASILMLQCFGINSLAIFVKIARH